MRLIAAVATAATLLVVAANANAYCRTSNCGDRGERTLCVPPGLDDCGTPILWDRNCIGFATQNAGSKWISATAAAAVLQQAFARWTHASCGEGVPQMRVQDLGQVPCSNVEYNLDGGNVNLLVFRDDVWPHIEKQNALALTIVTYDLDTNEIYDADIEVNGTVALVEQPTGVWFDLAGILTHEAGHALGLSHSPLAEATMFAEIGPMDTSFRDLDDDDIAGICAIYPWGSPVTDECNPISRHGFSDRCLAAQTHGDCSYTGGVAKPWWPVTLLSLLLLAFARRRWSTLVAQFAHLT